MAPPPVSQPAPRSTGSDRHQVLPTGAGPDPEPVQRHLRGIVRASYVEVGDHIVKALFEDLDSTGLNDQELAERTEVEKAQISRIRGGGAHPPGRLIAWAIDQSRHRPPRLVVAICSAAEGEFKPRPPPSVEERHAAMLDVLHEMGIDEVVRERMARRLGGNAP